MNRTLAIIFPRVAVLNGWQRRLLLVLATLLIAALAVSTVILFHGDRFTDLIFNDWSSPALYVSVAGIVILRACTSKHHQRAFALVGIALALYGLGNIVWAFWLGLEPNPPIPSLSDGLWLSFYPLTFVGLILLVPQATRRNVRAVLDATIVGTTVGAVSATALLGPILAHVGHLTAAETTELCYPVLDVVMLAVVASVMNLRGWRPDRLAALLATGFLLFTIADCAYALQINAGAIQPTNLTNYTYLVGAALMALAAWQDPPGAGEAKAPSSVASAAVFAFVAMALLGYDHFNGLNTVAYIFAWVAVVAAIWRMVITFNQARSLAEVRRQAETDELTSLPNRRLFVQRLGKAIEDAKANDGKLTLLLMDLDNFKQLNDTLGHLAGDELLRLIGPRICAVLRADDTVARLGGDEFAVLLSSKAGVNAGEHVAVKIRRSLAEPFMVGGLALRVTSSIGIASYPEDGSNFEELLKRSDIALYQAKATRSGHAHYASERDVHSTERLVMANELAVAIDRGELQVYFQPQSGANREIEGAEALLRWRRADGTPVSPAEFLPVGEQAGLSRPLTQLVLGRALDELKRWQIAGHCMSVSVNTTVADLLDDRFPEEVAEALQERRVDPARLVLEVTETSIMSDPMRISTVLNRLAHLGVTISLDDFGTGFSSLDHLRTLPVKELKIDRSFVSRMADDATDAMIVRATALLGQKLGMRIVAEGVEDDATWEMLSEVDSILIQGYRLSRPVTAADFMALLTAQATDASRCQQHRLP